LHVRDNVESGSVGLPPLLFGSSQFTSGGAGLRARERVAKGWGNPASGKFPPLGQRFEGQQ